MKVLIHEWVTGGGLAGSPLPDSWAAEGRAMRRAIASDFRSLGAVEVVVTLDDRFAADEPGGDTVVVGPGEEKGVLERWTTRCDHTLLIAPETGGILEERTRLVARAGGLSLGSTPDAVALSADKGRLARHLGRLGIRTPPTERFDAGSGLPRDFPYPAVVKPVDGAGSLETFFCESAEVHHFFSDDLPPGMVIQPFSPGTPMSATFLIGPGGSVALVGVGRQNVEIRDGHFHYRGGRLPAPAHFAENEPLAAIRSVEGLRGLVGVDFIRVAATGETTVIEINPRPTTSIVGLVRLLPPGTIARAWLDRLAGRVTGDDLRGMIDPGSNIEVTFFPDGGHVDGVRGG